MKLILNFIFILYFSLANAQTIEKNKYIDDRLGISFQVDENWKLSMDNSTVSAVNRSKSELITFNIAKLSTPNKVGYEGMTENDVQLFKNLLTKKYQDEGHRVKSIEVKKGKFQNYYCLTSIAHLEGQQYLDGIPIYKKQILFLLNENYQIGFIYFIPEKFLTNAEISKVEKQIQTFKNSK